MYESQFLKLQRSKVLLCKAICMADLFEDAAGHDLLSLELMYDE